MQGVGPGSLLTGRYAVHDRLLRHADWERWSGTDTDLDRDVVLLCFPTGGTSTTGVLDAARRAASVEDSRLVRLLDVGQDGLVGFVVEEATPGAESVTALLADGGLPPQEVRHIVAEAAEALATASVRGLHHGVLTPRDVLVLPDGSVKVRGLATQAALLDEREQPPDLASRTDAVALTGLLYAALTGRWPLPGSVSGLEAAPRVRSGVVPPSEITAAAPPDLDALVTRTLNWDEGPATPAEVADELFPGARRLRSVRRARAGAAFPVLRDDDDRADRRRATADGLTPPSAPVGASQRTPLAVEDDTAPLPHQPVPSRGEAASAPRQPVRTVRPARRPATPPRQPVGPPRFSGPVPSYPGTTPGQGVGGIQPPSELARRAGATATAAATGTAAVARSAATGTAAVTRSAATGTAAVTRSAATGTAAVARSAATGTAAVARSAATGTAAVTRSASERVRSGATAVEQTASTVAGHVGKAARATAQRAAERAAVRAERKRRRNFSNARLDDVLEETDERLEPPLPLALAPQAAAAPNRGESRLALTIVAGFVVVAAVLGVWGLPSLSTVPSVASAPRAGASPEPTTTPGPSPSASPPAGEPTPVAIVRAAAFEPNNGGQVASGTATRAYDGDPDTVWQSKWFATVDFGGFPIEGIGLIADLGQATEVRRVTLQLPVAQTGTVYVANQASLEEARPLGSFTDREGTVVLDAPTGAALNGELVIVYVTGLGPDGQGRFRAQVSELQVSQ